MRKVRNTYQSNGSLHHLPVLFGKRTPKARIGLRPNPTQFRNGHIADVAFLCQHYADNARQLLVGIGLNLLALNTYLSTQFGWKADRVRSSVDLPTPLAPSRQVSSPLLMPAQMPSATTFTSLLPG